MSHNVLLPTARRRAAVLVSALALLVTGAAAGAAPAASVSAASAESSVTVTVSEVDLAGPAVSPVKVTVTNGSSEPLRELSVSFSGPAGWAVHPVQQSWKGAVLPGGSAVLDFAIQVPEPRAGFRTYTFTAVASYRGGDGLATATGSRTQKSGTPLANLAAAYNNVGVTDETNTAPGNYDGGGNSFSAQKLADVGLVPGGSVTALGATFTWPSAAPGTRGNVAAAGQAIALSGQGSRLAFLGSGSSFGASGLVTVYYTDGTTSTGSLGFPNWSFQDATTYGATLVASSVGRNRPSGYGDSAYAYRVFANSVAIDPAKTVELVVLPSNGAVHVFDMAIVP